MSGKINMGCLVRVSKDWKCPRFLGCDWTLRRLEQSNLFPPQVVQHIYIYIYMHLPLCSSAVLPNNNWVSICVKLEGNWTCLVWPGKSTHLNLRWYHDQQVISQKSQTEMTLELCNPSSSALPVSICSLPAACKLHQLPKACVGKLINIWLVNVKPASANMSSQVDRK